MSDAFPEIREKQDLIEQIAAREEERFSSTLKQGTALLEGAVATASKAGGKTIEGDIAFKLHDTFGFPIDLTTEIAQESGLGVDQEGFKKLMQEQRDRARAGAYDRGRFGSGRRRPTAAGSRPDRVPRLRAPDHRLRGDRARLGRRGEIDRDRGRRGRRAARPHALLRGRWWPGRRPWLHPLRHRRGRGARYEPPRAGFDRAQSEGDGRRDRGRGHGPGGRRRAAQDGGRASTHRDAHPPLGPPGPARRARRHRPGPWSSPDGCASTSIISMRSIPTSSRTSSEEIERRVLVDDHTRAYETSFDYAKSIGAMAMFGEKYGDVVRVVEVGDYSKELCGGTHVPHTSQIGVSVVTAEGSVGANLRRVEALVGQEGVDYLQRRVRVLERAAETLKTNPEEVAERVEKLVATQKEMERRIAEIERKSAASDAAELASAAEDVNGTRLVVARRDIGVDNLRSLAQKLKGDLGSAVVLLGTVGDSNANLVAGVTKDLAGRGVSARDLLAPGAALLGGGGGRQARAVDLGRAQQGQARRSPRGGRRGGAGRSAGMILGVDPGERRVGLAVADDETRFARPLEVTPRGTTRSSSWTTSSPKSTPSGATSSPIWSRARSRCW